ncbi:MAG: hypothetical protein AAGO57_10100, partial [Pseudomonadota bacterium]
VLSSGTCKVTLKQDARFRGPVFLFTFGIFDDFYRISSFYIKSRELAVVQFKSEGAFIARRSRRTKQQGFLIPTRDPDQRRAIADWAAAHDIPVTGEI